MREAVDHIAQCNAIGARLVTECHAVLHDRLGQVNDIINAGCNAAIQ